ncbi:FliM/FliN family flagellar motor switch protein [Nereida sp. MMG025]|uniref:FliM/FliN family flagellar motor switch protein n=1 Tax=Nereida sp. MMG025 TaxID=2909981 RepID=UPI001F2AB480|nr:FliM/FliN family flagellar motor switch protein [Nereida sp. MMG025]MCF6443708.1 FliM/FliN family flagellar motor switch protein [Nereida sp. MMG025]
MSGQPTTPSVLAKKLRKDGTAQQADTTSLVRRAVAKAADQTYGLMLEVSQAKSETMTLDQAVSDIQGTPLLIELVHLTKGQGFAVLDAALQTALVQQATISKTTGGAPDDRPATLTDARLVAPFLNSLFALGPTALGAEGYSAQDMLASPRMISLRLPAGDFCVHRYGLSIAGGQGEGQLTLVMPVAQPDPTQDVPITARQTLSEPLQDAHVELSVVLHRVSWPLSKLRALEVGSHVPIPRHAPQSLEVRSVTGGLIGTADLGMLDGQKAIRLHRDKDLNVVSARSASPTPESVAAD